MRYDRSWRISSMAARIHRRCTSAAALLTLFASHLYGQQVDLQLILERLERLERQNRELMDEVRALRTELAEKQSPPAASDQSVLAERIEVQERRLEEQAQTK